MADLWESLGNFVNGTLSDTLRTGAGLVGEGMMQRGRLLDPLIGAALELPEIQHEKSQQTAALPQQAAALSAMSGGKVSVEQARSLLTADPSLFAKAFTEQLKPGAKTPPPKIFTPPSGGAFKLDDQGNLVPVPHPTGSFGGKPAPAEKNPPAPGISLEMDWLKKHPGDTGGAANYALAQEAKYQKPEPPVVIPGYTTDASGNVVPALASAPKSPSGAGPLNAPPGFRPGAPPKPPAPSKPLTAQQAVLKLAPYRTQYNAVGDLLGNKPSFGAWMKQNHPEVLSGLGITDVGKSKSTGKDAYKIDGKWHVF